jgi:hypothetical protein
MKDTPMYLPHQVRIRFVPDGQTPEGEGFRVHSFRPTYYPVVADDSRVNVYFTNQDDMRHVPTVPYRYELKFDDGPWDDANRRPLQEFLCAAHRGEVTVLVCGKGDVAGKA